MSKVKTAPATGTALALVPEAPLVSRVPEAPPAPILVPAGRGRVPLDRIDVVDRLRPVDAYAVEVLAASLALRGLDQPIVLRPHGARYRLVAGAHRLAAAQALGWPEIEASIQALNDAEARLVECEENLIRRELTVLDRAIFLVEHKRAYEAAYPVADKGRPKKHATNQDDDKWRTRRHFSERYSARAARATGLHEATIKRAIALIRALGPEVVRRLQGTPVADRLGDLKRLASLGEAERHAVVEALVARGARTLATVGDVGGQLPQITRTEAQFRALLTAWERASKPARDRFLKRIGLG